MQPLTSSVWDRRPPGAGSLRATSLVELYARMTRTQLAVLVVDSLTRHFRSRGATLHELSMYLGLPEATVAQATEQLPTSLVVSSVVGNEDDDNDDDGGDGVERRYWINYKTCIPYIAAHFSKTLLRACRVPLPPDASVASLHVRRSSEPTALFCCGCSSWLDVADLVPNSSQCGLCRSDIAASTILASAAAWEQQPAGATSCAARSPDGSPVPPLLRTDRFVLQQCLMMQFLCDTDFVFIDRHASIVSDPDDVTTKEEFELRSAHRSSLALQFRSKHRNGSHLRIRLVSQEETEVTRLKENSARLARRQAVPPWLSLQPQVDSTTTPPTPSAECPALKRPRLESQEPWRAAVGFARLVCQHHQDGDEMYEPVWSR